MTATEKLLTEQEVADRYGVQVNTVRTWRKRRIGPAYTTIGGGSIRYRLQELLAHEESRMSTRKGNS